MGVIILVLIVVTFSFQILFGSGLIPVSRKMKFWLVCVISLVSVFVIYFIHSKYIMHHFPEYPNRYGMVTMGGPYKIVAAAIVLTILIQILVKYFRNRKKS